MKANGNGHGGARKGAGRKPGVATRKTREIAERAIAEGITPLEVMLRVMRWHFEAGRYDDAAEVAASCAAYLHPRLGSLSVQADATVRVIEDDGWYQNRAHDLVAAGAASSGADAP